LERLEAKNVGRLMRTETLWFILSLVWIAILINGVLFFVLRM
jgi:hypothetical protein